MVRMFFVLGTLAAGWAVIFGAFGAHGLRKHLTPELLQTFETAARYQMYHALGLLAVSWACSKHTSRLVNAAGYLFCAGILLFSGSLYAYTLSYLSNPEGIKAFAMITPFGGVCFMAGWLCLGISALKWPKE